MNSVKVPLSSCVKIFRSLQLVVTTYSCGHEVHTDSKKWKSKTGQDETVSTRYYSEDHSREQHGQGGHETVSPKSREYVKELTKPEPGVGGGYGDDATRQVGAPDVSEYDEFYEWYQGTWHTTEKSPWYKSFMMAEETSTPSSQEVGGYKKGRSTLTVPYLSRRGAASLSAYKDLGSNGTTPKKLSTKSRRKTFSKSLLTADGDQTGAGKSIPLPHTVCSTTPCIGV